MKEVVFYEKPNITMFYDVIPDEICDEIINKHIRDNMNPNSGKQSRQESYAQVTERVENRGISLGVDPKHYDYLTSLVVKYSRIPFNLIESLEIYNYPEGKFLDLHHDYCYFPRHINYYRYGGDRVGTGIFFLNDDFEGGVINFPKLNVTIKPKKGSYLYFKQSYVDEQINWDTLHESTIITKGTKWISATLFSDRPRVGYLSREIGVKYL